MRVGSTMTFKTDSKRKLPNFISDLYDYFSDVDEAWEYFRAYSWCVMAVEFAKFCKKYKNKEIAKSMENQFFGLLINIASEVYNFKADPYGAKDMFLKVARRFGRKYLPSDKKQFVYYNTPILWRIYNIYQSLKSAERKFRHWRKGLFKKANK